MNDAHVRLDEITLWLLLSLIHKKRITSFMHKRRTDDTDYATIILEWIC